MWSRCRGCTPCTPLKAAKRHTWTPKKRVCRHRWWPQQRFCKLSGAAAEGLHLLRRPNGTLEPPRKESAGTGGGHSSAFASCVELLRRVYTLEGGQTAHLSPQEKSLPAQVVATAALLQAVWSRCGRFTSLGRPPNGTLEPPRKESAGTGGGHSSAFASCVEPLRRVYTF